MNVCVRVMQAAPPIMHCRNLNPYVVSTLTDWSKSHMQNAQIPRGANALPHGTHTNAAGVLRTLMLQFTNLL